MRIAIVLTMCAAVVIAAQPAALPRAAPESVGLDPNRLSEATALLNQFVIDRKIAGAVAAVARDGKVAYLEAVGFQNLESRTPMTERSLFRIYSMTKAVTAVAAMRARSTSAIRYRNISATSELSVCSWNRAAKAGPPRAK